MGLPRRVTGINGLLGLRRVCNIDLCLEGDGYCICCYFIFL